MLLTHYSRVTEIERLAGDLRRQIGELAALGRAGRRQAGPRRATARRACASWCSAGSATTARRCLPSACEELVALDIELNAQGLEAWLDRDRRG